MTDAQPRVGLLDVLGQLGADGATYPGLLRSMMLIDADRAAARCGDDRVSYGDLLGRVAGIAVRLTAAGVGPGDRVAVMLPNSVNTLAVHLGIQAVGAVGALVNTSLFGEPLQQVLQHSRATAAVVSPSLEDALDGARAAAPHVEAVLCIREPVVSGETALLLELLGERVPTPLDPAFINYTSGTTGLSKGVVLKHVFSAGALVLGRQLDLSADERIYLPTPMYHALGLAMSAMSLRLGAELVIAPRFSASRYWRDIREHQCTVAYHVGTIARMLANQPPEATDGDHNLKVFLGGGMPAEIWETFAQRFRVSIIESYSASDGIGSITNWGDGPVGSIGRPPPELEVRVVDTDDQDVPTGVAGELQLRPAGGGFGGPAVVYDADEAATAEKNEGGWVRTGDLVRRDAEGWLFFVDRLKDVIRRRGVNIAPAEIERVIAGHEGVRECAALAVPSDLGEDDIKLVVVGDHAIDVDALTGFMELALPAHMRPRYLEQVDSLPKTMTERVQRYQLKGAWRTAATVELAYRTEGAVGDTHRGGSSDAD